MPANSRMIRGISPFGVLRITFAKRSCGYEYSIGVSPENGEEDLLHISYQDGQGLFAVIHNLPNLPVALYFALLSYESQY